MTGLVRGGRSLVVLAVLVPLSLVACGRSATPPTSVDPIPAGPPLQLEINPASGRDQQPLSTEIGMVVAGGVVNAVSLTDERDRPVAGRMRADGSSWVPDQPLAPQTTYHATVTATSADGDTTTAQTRFTTMAEPTNRATTTLYLQDGQEYGVAMPVVVQFPEPVPEEARAEVQRRMFVHTDPPQPGVWHWVADGQQAFYRAPEHWQPGTTLDVRIALDGHPLGDGRYGDADRSATVTIGSELSIEIDNATKRMTVSGTGVPTRALPVSLGKSSTPTSSGNLVVMSREASALFDTFAELGPVEGYRVTVAYALRLTWGGEYIHAAPWSVADQGVRNVSHGCINLSTESAGWLYEVVKIGDPVAVTGTETSVTPGNGWTAWDLSWEEFAAGSALPVAEDLTQAATATMLAAG